LHKPFSRSVPHHPPLKKSPTPLSFSPSPQNRPLLLFFPQGKMTIFLNAISHQNLLTSPFFIPVRQRYLFCSNDGDFPPPRRPAEFCLLMVVYLQDFASSLPPLLLKCRSPLPPAVFVPSHLLFSRTPVVTRSPLPKSIPCPSFQKVHSIPFFFPPYGTPLVHASVFN